MQAALEYKPDFPEAVERMKRFWDIEEPGDRVPTAIYLPEPEGRKADGSFYGRLGDYVAHMEEYFWKRAVVRDEYFPTVVPQYGHTIISTLLGCEVRHAAETLWSIPCMTGGLPEADLSLDWGNEWGARFRQSGWEVQEAPACAVTTSTFTAGCEISDIRIWDWRPGRGVLWRGGGWMADFCRPFRAQVYWVRVNPGRHEYVQPWAVFYRPFRTEELGTSRSRESGDKSPHSKEGG